MLESMEDQETYDPENAQVRYTDTYQSMVKFFSQKLVDFN